MCIRDRFTGHGDTFSSIYELLEDDDAINEVIIEEIDGTLIKGTFEISLINKNVANGNPFNIQDPEIIIFTNGEFEANYVEE